jgi:Ca2+:H+ antiporter
MQPLLKEIRDNPLLWMLVFVPVVLVAEAAVPHSHTLLFVLSVLAIMPLAALRRASSPAAGARLGSSAPC